MSFGGSCREGSARRRRSGRTSDDIVANLAFIYTLQFGWSWASVPIQLLGGILTVYVLLRFGLVSSVVAWSVFVCFLIFPMTLHVSAWYSTIGFATLAAVLALSLYGFWTALGNRPLLDLASAED